ncbi:MAG: hypothetical protein HY918_05495 [Candidatus Doudnabacteria bacterium]|nr:hypothetical protein [Candidatus Doudnabacteria bacterium]
MKIIIICGPTASGKDSVIDEMYRELNQEYPGKVSQATYFKTRAARPQEKIDKYFISEEEFEKKRGSGEIPDEFWGEVSNYRVGYSINEFTKSEIVLVNIDDKKARNLKEVAQQSNNEVLSIFLHAPEEVRKQRFMSREGWLIYEPAEYRLSHDVTDPNPENHKDFDLIVENKEGALAETMKEIMPAVKEFVESNKTIKN